jgi:AcrR family transcriptional regulator
MRAKRKADYHHGRLRQALIETAVKTIAQKGIDALSLPEIGRLITRMFSALAACPA